jgi:hypothetical protein
MQKWTIEEISIFSNSSHLEWRARMSGHNFEKGPPQPIFRGEDLNVKTYHLRRTPSDGKSSHGLFGKVS